jgi:hypothetical protein
VYLRLAISSDGARVYFNNQGTVFSLDTATGQFFLASTGYGCCFGDYELSLSSNQTRLEASSYSYDSDLNAEAPLTANIRELITATYVYGAKLSPDGTLLFQPSFSGIDVFDGRTGTLRTRLALPFLMSPNYDALVSNGKDNVLLAITGNNGDGIAVVDLTSFLEPSPLPYFRKAPLQTQNLRPPMLQRSTVLVTGSDLLQQAAPSPAQGRSIQHVARAPLFPR